MRMISSTFLSFILFIPVAFSYSPTLCTIPPDFWCDTPETIALCNAQSQCAAYQANVGGKKLKISLLYEALCPDCQQFITQILYPQIWTNLKDIVDVELIPYGNAKEDFRNGTWQFTCQHGPAECSLNKLHSCAIYYLANDTDAQLSLINCLESQKNLQNPAEFCFTKLGIPDLQKHKIYNCKGSDLGTKLLHHAAVKTATIWPVQHTFVPWVLINDVSTRHMQDLQLSLAQSICDMYRGPKAPEACQMYQTFHRREKHCKKDWHKTL